MIRKIVLCLLFLVLILLIGFVAIGFIFPNIEYKTTVEINKPKEFVWTILTDKTKSKDWVIGLQNNELISGQPDGIGSKTKIVLNRDGRIDEFVRELVDINPPEKIVTKLENDYVSHEMTVELSDAEGKTKIVSIEKLAGKNFIASSFLPIMKSNIVKLSQNNFDSLKKFAESSK